MASRDEIIHRISLEGTEEIERKLKRAAEVSEATAKRIKTSFEAAGNLGGASNGIEEHPRASEAAVHSIREALHTLHPVLASAGLEIGNLGSFARLAGAGLAPLAAALTGSLLISLAKVGEEALKIGNRLKALSGGQHAFEEISNQAKQLGTDVGIIHQSIERLLAQRQKLIAQQNEAGGIIHPPGFEAGSAEESANNVSVIGGNGVANVPSRENLTKAFNALFYEGRMDNNSGTEITGNIDKFLGDIQSKGGLTPQALEGFRATQPNAANFVARSLSQTLGQNFDNAAELSAFLEKSGKPIPQGQIFPALARREDQAQLDAAGARGVSEAFEELEASAKRLAEALSGNIGLTSAIDTVSKLIDKATQNVDQQLNPRDFEPGGEKFIGPVTPSERQDYNTPDVLDVGKALFTGQADERFSESAAIKAAKFLNVGPTSLQQTPSEALDAIQQSGENDLANSLMIKIADFLRNAIFSPEKLHAQGMAGGGAVGRSVPLHYEVRL